MSSSRRRSLVEDAPQCQLVTNPRRHPLDPPGKLGIRAFAGSDQRDQFLDLAPKLIGRRLVRERDDAPLRFQVVGELDVVSRCFAAVRDLRTLELVGQDRPIAGGDARAGVRCLGAIDTDTRIGARSMAMVRSVMF